MSTTDQRTGFRLPWSAESRTRDAESEAETPDGTDQVEPDADASETSVIAEDSTTHENPDETASADSGEPVEDMTWPEVDRRVRQIGRRAVDRADASLAEITTSVATGVPTPVTRRTNALMAGLSKAMHAAAESARAETLERLAADATERTEAIKAGAAEEAAAIKLAADNDVAGVRDWSKAELTRVREETESRIAARRESLEQETANHAAKVEARIERVKRVVTSFEATMAEFFETLLAESDPARVALLAEQLPEPPSLEVDDDLEAAYEAFEAAADAADAEATSGSFEAASETGEVTEAIVLGDAAEDVLIGETVDGETVDGATDGDGNVEDGLDPEAAAEAEAEAFAAAEDAPEADDAEADTETTALSEEALAARLAKMETAEAENASAATTELVVTGLVSVAGIAGFKRAITRIPGVTGVGVTSGPGGEFVYSVNHGSDTDFSAAVEALPGFSARVTGESEGSLQITASDHNPEN